MMITGRVWKVGDDVGATDLVPGRYDKAGMQRDWPECAKHVLEDLAPEFAGAVRPGDILIGGDNFGAGHAHYYMAAIMGTAATGVQAMLADSVNALFLRAAIDAGVITWSLRGISDLVTTGDELQVDLETGAATNLTTGKSAKLPAVSPIVLDILTAGGTRPWALDQVRSPDQVSAT